MLALSKRMEHVGSQNNTIIHRDGNVPLDLHVVANFGSFSHSSSRPVMTISQVFGLRGCRGEP